MINLKKGLGNWADDDIDFNSISVPILNRKPDNHLKYQSNSSSYFSNTNFNHVGGHQPPFIVKITNLPGDATLHIIKDLFESRFMRFKKVKIFWELKEDPLFSKNVPPEELIDPKRKCAFVELESSMNMDKVLKWDVKYGSLRSKLQFFPGNFEDFRLYNDFNQKLSEKFDPEVTTNLRPVSKPVASTSVDSQAPAPVIKPKPKSNPFGNAKPVDTLSKELELEKALSNLAINKTTFRTLGFKEDEKNTTQKHKQHTSNSSRKPTSNGHASDTAKLSMKPAPVAPSVWGSSKSVISAPDDNNPEPVKDQKKTILQRKESVESKSHIVEKENQPVDGSEDEGKSGKKKSKRSRSSRRRKSKAKEESSTTESSTPEPTSSTESKRSRKRKSKRKSKSQKETETSESAGASEAGNLQLESNRGAESESKHTNQETAEHSKKTNDTKPGEAATGKDSSVPASSGDGDVNSSKADKPADGDKPGKKRGGRRRGGRSSRRKGNLSVRFDHKDAPQESEPKESKEPKEPEPKESKESKEPKEPRESKSDGSQVPV